LSLLAGLVYARGTDASKDLDKEAGRKVSSKIDPLSSSFYLDVVPKATQAAASGRRAKQAILLSKIFACGAVCDMVGIFRRLIGRQIVTPGAIIRLLARGQERDAADEEGVAEVAGAAAEAEPADALATEGGPPRMPKWSLAGSSGLALFAASVALRRSTARSRRPSLSSVKVTVDLCKQSARSRAAPKLLSGRIPTEDDDRSTVDMTPGRSVPTTESCAEDSEVDLAPEPCVEDVPQGSDAATNARRRLFSEELSKDLAMNRRRANTAPIVQRQRTEPQRGDTVIHGQHAQEKGFLQQRRLSTGFMTRQRSHPAEAAGSKLLTDDVTGNTDEAAYGAGGFVRQRTLEYERRIDFHRMASENSVNQQADEWEGYMELKTDFYRIGTETAC